jgi:hypothetical protein
MENRVRTVLLRVGITFVAVCGSYILAAIRVDSPEQLVAEMQKAASRGDVEGYLSRLTSESRKIVETSYSGSEELREAQAKYEKALDQKFGKGGEWIPDSDSEQDIRDAVARITAVEVVSKTESADGSVVLKIRTTIRTDGDKTEVVEEIVGARRENEEWKLSLGYPDPGPYIDRVKSEIERVAGEIREGKYEDRVEAMIALDNAIRRIEVK